MSARPHFLRGYVSPDFVVTEGHTLPAVAEIPHAVPLVTAEGGCRLDTHRVIPPGAWLSDADLAAMATAEDLEEARRAVTRERLRQVQADMRISRRDWSIWAACTVGAVLVSCLLPGPWAGYGWHLGLVLP